MLFDLFRSHDRGWALPRFRSCMLQPVRGVLTVSDHYDPVQGRHLNLARFLEAGSSSPLDVQPLYNVTVLKIQVDHLVLARIERIEDETSERLLEFHQSWMLQEVRD